MNSAGALQLAVSLGGDVNGDRQADLKDGTLIKCQYGATSASPLYNGLADANRDGRIDSSDYADWRTNLGDSTSLNPLTLTAAISPAPTLLPSPVRRWL